MTNATTSPFDAQLERCNEPGRLCWICELPDVLASMNRLLRVHWGARRNYTAGFEKIAEVFRRESNIPPAKKRRELYVIQYRRRPLDKDNLYGSVKPLVDGLKKAGLLVDDSEKWLDLHSLQVRIGGDEEQRTAVILSESSSSA